MIVASCNEKDNQFKLVSYQNVPENNYKFVLAENKLVTCLQLKFSTLPKQSCIKLFSQKMLLIFFV